MSRSAVVLVVDGLGVGAMHDAGSLRPGDAQADTLGSVVAAARERGHEPALGALAALGLASLRPDLHLQEARNAARGQAARAALGYPGADTFAGHQTLMGADMSHVVLCRVAERMEEVTAALTAAGHTVHPLDGRPLLVVDDVALVHDNLEADPGLNWNVSCDLRAMPFDEIVAIARIVRSVAPVARVIAVGGFADAALSDAVRSGAGDTVGLDTPASGFYRNGGLQVLHLGAEIDVTRQLPQRAADAGVAVTLIGKAADILATETLVTRLPNVETDAVLADTVAAAGAGLVVANVQQTDLAGHSQDAERWVELLEQVDAAIDPLLARLGPDGVLVVTGDHGNDPRIGHGFHTREHVPVLAVRGNGQPAWRARDADSLADVGATVAAWLGVTGLATGTPLAEIPPHPGA